MNRVITAAALTCLLSTSALAQTTSATGVGIGAAEANSASGAIAVNRGNGGSSNLTINNPANTTQNVNSTVSGTTTANVNTRVSGSSTLKTNPSMAVGLTSAGLETCLGSASAGLSLAGFGAVGGSTYVDEGCQARLDSRTLASYGLKAAAVARLCQRADIWRSMPDVCTQYWPAGQPLPYGIAVAAPLVAPSGTYMSTSIRVIDGRDGIEKDCLNYNATRQKCNHWAGEQPKRVRSAALTPAKSQVKPQSKPKPAPAVEAIETAAPTPDNK